MHQNDRRTYTVHIPAAVADRIERLRIGPMPGVKPSASKVIGALVERGLDVAESETTNAATRAA